jgi:aspartate 1-decarboxylase
MYSRTMLKSKIHRATVTDADLHYEGSITIDETLMEAADILPYEKVQVVNISNAARFETYAIAGPRNSGAICLNGGAAHHAKKGDLVIILSYCSMPEEEAPNFLPRILYVDEGNFLLRLENQIEASDLC